MSLLWRFSGATLYAFYLADVIFNLKRHIFVADRIIAAPVLVDSTFSFVFLRSTSNSEKLMFSVAVKFHFVVIWLVVVHLDTAK